ncbi:serine hydrolase domain-containing protein [Lutimaribacter marinistellae]|uniref:Serine hydrolase domain-containing protein n=1 Tax=Lutimaribacter marinistellae TaxID=1820329 RepID=A0ABV7TM86_9RHOB
MARWKNPPPLGFVEAATSRFSFPNWQSGNDDSIFYNLNIPSFFKSRTVAAQPDFSFLDRAINADLLDITFDNLDGSTNPPLREYLVGPRQVQAMMMAYRGKVVFEIFPGMNPMDYHVWMSASKTTAGLLVSMLANEGAIDMEQPMSTYIPELAGSFWDNVSVKNTMNMSVGVDNEETFESLSNPDSWITKFFTAIFTPADDPSEWRSLLKEVQPLSDEKPGDVFRYSTSNTQALVLLVEQVTQMSWEAYWNQRIWSKIGARGPFMIGLAPDGTPVGGGLNFTTLEDMLRYALIYTPSWNVVSEEQIVTDALLKEIQTLGNPEAYANSTEIAYGQRWFGETPAFNTAQWDHAFEDGAMFKHGNMGQGIYVDPGRDFCGCYFGLATNDESVAGVDHSPGYLRAAAKLLAGE